MGVLLVEDNDLVRQCIVMVLADAGTHAVETSDAEQALALLDTVEAPSILVTDMSLGAGKMAAS